MSPGTLWPILVSVAAVTLGGCFQGSDLEGPVPGPRPQTDDVPGDVEDHPAMSGEPIVTTQGDATPPPIQGGTLLVSGGTAIASDPGSDRIHFVDLASRLVESIQLEAGSEPGRLAADADGRVHVVLRGAGTLTTLDVAGARRLMTRTVCPTPHGITFDAVTDTVHVACESGELVSLPSEGGTASRVLRLEPGLRDVVMEGERLRVSHFKRAELLELDSDGTVAHRYTPDAVRGFFESPVFPSPEPRERTMEPAVAWRAVSLGDGRTLVVHQRAQLDEVDLGDDSEEPDPFTGQPAGTPPPPMGPGGDGAYGGALGCGSIVHSTVSVLGPDGSAQTSPPIAGMVLPVDAAVGPGGLVAIAAAGNSQSAPLMFPAPPVSVLAATLDQLEEVPDDGCIIAGFPDAPTTALADVGQAVAVAFTNEDQLLVQSRVPNALTVFRLEGNPVFLEQLHQISLGQDVLDAGHDLYHLNAGAGIACASCHPGGADDGRTWFFKGLGPRRSQASNAGLAGTEPFHWDGDMVNLTHLVDEVFVGRMGGFSPSVSELVAFERWLFALRPPTPIRALDDEAAQRGKTLFDSVEVGCRSCHSGDQLTNNQSLDVGTGGSFQVPSLVGVGYRIPLMHDGCAQSLRDRFEPGCAGSAHGNTDHLSQNEVDDLVAYLEAL